MKKTITVQIIVNIPIEKAWEYWSKPEHITKWTFASDDWEAPFAENDLQINGKFKTRMQAKNKSQGFDFTGTYTNIKKHELIEYIMDDNRSVSILFEKIGNHTQIIETFDPENENPSEMQREGWQAILNNYKKYVESKTNKISPCLWFDNQAEDAAKFYTSIFKNSSIKEITKYSSKTPSNKPIGSVLTVTFNLDGQEFTALNGGPIFKFTEAISLMIYCKDQEEIDYFYEKLSAVPEAEICGWLKDKYGVSWQLVSTDMGELMNSKEAMDAMLKMKRIDINKLRKIKDN